MIFLLFLPDEAVGVEGVVLVVIVVVIVADEVSVIIDKRFLFKFLSKITFHHVLFGF